MKHCMARFWYYLGCFLAAVILESFPKFLFEINQPVLFFERFLMLGLFLLVAWFFKYSLKTPWKWSIVSSMFFVDAALSVGLAVSLFLQFFSPWFMLLSAALLLLRAGVFSYLAADRLPTLKGLVFFTCFVFLVCAEMVLTFGLQPF